jgi:hypothetical protein
LLPGFHHTSSGTSTCHCFIWNRGKERRKRQLYRKEDIRRIIEVRSAKQACSTLLQRGSIGDDLWQRFLRAEKEMEEELRDVVMEVCNPFQG